MLAHRRVSATFRARMQLRAYRLLGQAALRAPGRIARERVVLRCMASSKQAQQEQAYKFGKWPIAPAEVFANSKHSYAFVNLKPLVPGHVLVAPLREAPRFTDLQPEEVADLWGLAQRVGIVIERHHAADSLTLTIQDGPAAGQTVPHVHVHVLPRKFGDFKPNDAVYEAIDAASKDAAALRTADPLDLDIERVARSPEEMAAEAAQLRPLFEMQG